MTRPNATEPMLLPKIGESHPVRSLSSPLASESVYGLLKCVGRFTFLVRVTRMWFAHIYIRSLEPAISSLISRQCSFVFEQMISKFGTELGATLVRGLFFSTWMNFPPVQSDVLRLWIASHGLLLANRSEILDAF